MLVQFLHPSPKATQQLRPDLPLGVDDVENVAGSALVVAGFAEELKYKNYVERLSILEKARAKASKPQQPVQWGIREALCNDPYSPRFVLTKTTEHETLHFSTLPQDAPPNIKQRWNDLHATDAALYKDRQEFLKRQASEPRTTTGFNEGDLARVVVIGGKRG